MVTCGSVVQSLLADCRKSKITVINHTCRLTSVLEGLWGRDELPEVPGFIERFPESITLARTAAAWKHIAVYYHHKQTIHASMD